MKIYVFDDGRIVYDAALLTKADKGHYAAVDRDSLEPIEVKYGFIGYYQYNAKSRKVEVKYDEQTKEQDWGNFN